MFSLLRGSRMKKLLRRMLDETEFLSPYGVRALSRAHLDHLEVAVATLSAHRSRPRAIRRRSASIPFLASVP